MLKRFLLAAATASAVVLTAGGATAAFASTSYQPVYNYSHNVVNDKSGKCMDNSDFNWVNGNPVQQWTCGASGGVDQNLRLVDTNGYEALAFVQPGSATPWYVTEDGFRGQLTISDVPDESAQALTETNGVFTFTTSGLVADDKGQSVSDGAEVIGYTYNAGSNQVWTQLRQPVNRIPVLDVYGSQVFSTASNGDLTGTVTGSSMVVAGNPDSADEQDSLTFTYDVKDVNHVPVHDESVAVTENATVNFTDTRNDTSYVLNGSVPLKVAETNVNHYENAFTSTLNLSALEGGSYTVTHNGDQLDPSDTAAVLNDLFHGHATVSSASGSVSADVTAQSLNNQNVANIHYFPVNMTQSYAHPVIVV